MSRYYALVNEAIGKCFWSQSIKSCFKK